MIIKNFFLVILAVAVGTVFGHFIWLGLVAFRGGAE